MGDTFILDSPALESAVKSIYSANYQRARPRKTSVDAYAPIFKDYEVVKIFNTSDKKIEQGSCVKLDTDLNEELYLHPDRNFWGIAGAPMDDGKGFWGVAVDDIEPQKYGCVQVSGVAILSSKYLKGVYKYYDRHLGTSDSAIIKRNEYIFAGRDGFFHLGNHGQASVIYYSKSTENALVLLGCPSINTYDGMFAVHDNGDKTLTVKGGDTDLNSYYSGGSFKDTVLPVSYDNSIAWHYVCLIASWKDGSWSFSADIHRYPGSFYVPGEKIFIPLARYSGIRSDGYISGLVQLHQGGMVNFKERYYIEE